MATLCASFAPRYGALALRRAHLCVVPPRRAPPTSPPGPAERRHRTRTCPTGTGNTAARRFSLCGAAPRRRLVSSRPGLPWSDPHGESGRASSESERSRRGRLLGHVGRAGYAGFHSAHPCRAGSAVRWFGSCGGAGGGRRDENFESCIMACVACAWPGEQIGKLSGRKIRTWAEDTGYAECAGLPR